MNFIKEYAIYIVAWYIVGIVLMVEKPNKEVEDLSVLTEKLRKERRENND